MIEFLFRSERSFQFKYQQHSGNFDSIDLRVVMNSLGRILYRDFASRFRGKRMSLEDLMSRHTLAYDITENLHDLFCRGMKDYKEALANVQIYNMTKILSTKCSIPNDSGDIKRHTCDFTVIHAVQMDIELYNYCHTVFKDYTSGKFKRQAKGKSSSMEGNKHMFDKVLSEKIEYQFMPLFAQNDMDFTRRCNSDVMNNFFINIVASAFTDIEDTLYNKF
mmetsp:Transcript_18786/g.32102  ORF Transcript_18786/g.32102 Transcript_18786/m.32102 type:complete len:220 (+) Transcript_18786:680-1339(+)